MTTGFEHQITRELALGDPRKLHSERIYQSQLLLLCNCTCYIAQMMQSMEILTIRNRKPKLFQYLHILLTYGHSSYLACESV